MNTAGARNSRGTSMASSPPTFDAMAFINAIREVLRLEPITTGSQAQRRKRRAHGQA